MIAQSAKGLCSLVSSTESSVSSSLDNDYHTALSGSQAKSCYLGMSIELGLAVVATADLCLKYGQILMQKIADFRSAESEIVERSLSIELHWKKTRSQLSFIQQIWDDLDDEHQQLQERILQTLVEKLSRAAANLEKVMKKTSRRGCLGDQQAEVHRFKYVLIKESLDATIEDLAKWQRLFDPTWFLVMRMNNPSIDRELSKLNSGEPHASVISRASGIRSAIKNDGHKEAKLFLGDAELKTGEIVEIPFSTVKQFRRATSKTWMILDVVPCVSDGNLRQMKEDIRDLGRKLSLADSTTFGHLQCRGVVIENDSSGQIPRSFDFLFSLPKDMSNPQSLRAHLLDGAADRSLSERLRIAKQLVQCVSYVHLYGFVHKNIRPETILCLDHHLSTSSSVFLVGFQKFRSASGSTLKRGDLSWEANFYRHPDRQGVRPESYYVMQHDIYSLGVCLLEVGLWESLIVYDENLRTAPSLRISPEDAIVTPLNIKDRLVCIAKEVLPSKMGDLYTLLVVNCLTCLDPDNEDFGDEQQFEDVDGILIAVKYIEKILLHIDKISI